MQRKERIGIDNGKGVGKRGEDHADWSDIGRRCERN